MFIARSNALFVVAISSEQSHIGDVGEGIFVRRTSRNRQSGKWGQEDHGQGNCIMAAKRGRPSKSGDRYKCGKLRPAETSKQQISPALWHRIKTNGQKIGLDPRLGTELGRLALHDELTSAEVSAGFRIA